MVDFVLYLGQIGFQDFEVPEHIRAGGAQMLATRKYPGGVRTVDAMGPDDDPLAWGGWFEGPSALQRCQQLDIMRRQGQAIYAVWSAYAYLAVIKDFRWEFWRNYHIRYDLSLQVVQDLRYPPPQAPGDADSQMTSDLSDAQNDSAGLTAAPPVGVT